jgi:hypothetical protein
MLNTNAVGSFFGLITAGTALLAGVAPETAVTAMAASFGAGSCYAAGRLTHPRLSFRSAALLATLGGVLGAGPLYCAVHLIKRCEPVSVSEAMSSPQRSVMRLNWAGSNVKCALS